MNDTTKKLARRLTDDEKAGINQMLLNKVPHKDIIETYAVSSGTISNMAKKLSAKTSQASHKDSKNIAALKNSLIAIRNRKILVEEMLMGSLRQELDQLAIAEENLEKNH